MTKSHLQCTGKVSVRSSPHCFYALNYPASHVYISIGAFTSSVTGEHFTLRASFIHHSLSHTLRSPSNNELHRSDMICGSLLVSSSFLRAFSSTQVALCSLTLVLLVVLFNPFLIPTTYLIGSGILIIWSQTAERHPYLLHCAVSNLKLRYRSSSS